MGFMMLTNNIKVNQPRQSGLDILKCICAFLIVCIHAPFPGEFGKVITALARCAVPVFFIISGYFYNTIVQKKRENRQIKKVFLLFLVSNIIYFVFKCALNFKNFSGYICEVFNLENILDFLFFNESPFAVHLWYLGAFLYVLIIVKIFRKLNIERILFWLVPVLLVCDLIFGKYSMLIFKTEFPLVYARNFLFVGLPYFCIGEMLQKGISNQKICFSKMTMAVFTVLFAITTIAERYIVLGLEMGTNREHYISTTFLAVSLVLLFLNIDSNNKISTAMSDVGRRYSANIYIFHPIFIVLMDSVVKRAGVSSLYSIIKPAAVFAVTLIVLILLSKLKEKIKKDNHVSDKHILK